MKHLKKYSEGINNQTTNLRDLLEFKKVNKPLNIDEVEPMKKLHQDLEAEVCHMELYHQKLMKH